MSTHGDDTARMLDHETILALGRAEERRRHGVEMRGIYVLASSGVLVVLLLALALVLRVRGDVTLGLGAPAVLTASAMASVVAAVLALAASGPQTTRVVGPHLLHGAPREEVSAAGETMADRRRDHVVAVQRSNDLRSFLLLLALAAHVLSVLLVAVAVAALL